MATSLVVALLVPVIGAVSQGGTLTAPLLWAVAILVPVHVMMMLAFEIPDLITDAAAGKRVIAVRIGRDRTILVMVGLLAVSGLVAVAGWASAGLTGTAVGGVSLATIPGLATVVLARQEQPGALTASAVATLVVVALALAVAS